MTMISRKSPVAVASQLLAFLCLSVAATAGADEIAPLCRALGERIGAPPDAVESLVSQATEIPTADLWAVTDGEGQVVTLAVETVHASGESRAASMSRETALRKSQVLAATAAFFPWLRDRLEPHGFLNPLAQRAALRHLVAPDAALALLRGGAVTVSDAEGELAMSLLVVPVASIAVSETQWDTDSLCGLYERGLRTESRRAMGRGAFEDALTCLLELRSFTGLSVADEIAVARCFSETERADDAVEIIDALVGRAQMDFDELLSCGDIALAVNADSLAAHCYRLCEASLLGE